MHWEVQNNYPDRVYFHVEAPSYENDPKLNDLKNRMISKILNSKIERSAKSNNFDYVQGRLTSSEMIKKIKVQEYSIFFLIIPIIKLKI